MKSFKFAMATGLMVAAVGVWGQTSPVVGTPWTGSNYTPGAGITGTAHDFSSAANAGYTSGGQTVLLWAGTLTAGVYASTTDKSVTGIPYTGVGNGTGAGPQLTTHITIGQCTKCHTPHQAKSTNLLWNHTLSTNTYQWDQPATTAGTVYPKFVGTTYKGPTTKCLSCHDGSIASTDGVWFNRAFISGTIHAPTPGQTDSHDVASATGSMVGTHPVAMPYPLNGLASTYNFTTNGSMINPGEWVADPSQTNNIRLFNDDGTGNVTAGSVAGKSGIECTSCHDVHNGSRVKDDFLLTGQISGSSKASGGYICQQCHNK
jgi:hypothetical protein